MIGEGGGGDGIVVEGERDRILIEEGEVYIIIGGSNREVCIIIGDSSREAYIIIVREGYRGEGITKEDAEDILKDSALILHLDRYTTYLSISRG